MEGADEGYSGRGDGEGFEPVVGAVQERGGSALSGCMICVLRSCYSAHI